MAEEKLVGPELSVLALCDGKSARILPPDQLLFDQHDVARFAEFVVEQHLLQGGGSLFHTSWDAQAVPDGFL